jgi:hypothetical protein
MKRLRLIALCLVLSAAVLPLMSAHAAEAPVSPALCSAAAGSAIAWKTSGGCGASFCTSVAQCHCTGATSVSCSGGICHYTLPGGGGGSGGGSGSGGQCPQQRFCNDNSDCSYSLPSVQGTCSGGTCHC